MSGLKSIDGSHAATVSGAAARLRKDAPEVLAEMRRAQAEFYRSVGDEARAADLEARPLQ